MICCQLLSFSFFKIRTIETKKKFFCLLSQIFASSPSDNCRYFFLNFFMTFYLFFFQRFHPFFVMQTYDFFLGGGREDLIIVEGRESLLFWQGTCVWQVFLSLLHYIYFAFCIKICPCLQRISVCVTFYQYFVVDSGINWKECVVCSIGKKMASPWRQATITNMKVTPSWWKTTRSQMMTTAPSRWDYHAHN